MHIRTLVSDVRHDVTNTHTAVSNTHDIFYERQRSVTTTETMVSDIHPTMVENQEGTGSKNRSVSVTFTSPITEPSLTVT